MFSSNIIDINHQCSSIDKPQNKERQSIKTVRAENDNVIHNEYIQHVDDTSSSQFNISLPPTKAKQVILIDVNSGVVLLEKNAHMPMSPSSMTKIATACFVASKLKSGELNFDTKFTVSRNAYRKEGSTMFLNIDQKVSVKDLLYGLIISSANDAAVVLAEGICGTEELFAIELTKFVKSLGAINTNFENGHGLPAQMHKTTAYDLAIIARQAITDYPEVFDIYSHTSFSFNGISQRNKNVFLSKGIGCDGLKTGHTNEGGYGIAVTCVSNGRRLLLVVNGYKNEQDRTTDASALLTWGLNTFIMHSLYRKNHIIAKIPVWYGEDSELPITVENDTAIILPRSSPYDAKITLNYYSPVTAPIPKGMLVGEMRIISGTMHTPLVLPLVATITIKEASFFKKIVDSFVYLIWGVRKPKMFDLEQKEIAKQS
jgi:D-alanyl-D-alanine carboxypeptidase (penicillin-binding protein 5/6)